MKGPFALIVALLGLFPGSGAVGLWLAAVLAPGSFFAEVVSFFALPLAFVLGLQLWYGLAIFGVLARLIGLAGSRTARQSARTIPLPGTFVFLPLSSTFAAVAGVLVGLVSPQPIWFVAMVYWLAGTIHGMVAWRLARAGVLVPPESF